MGGRRLRTQMFAELQNHYLLDDRFGRLVNGNGKGKIAGLVGFVRRNFMTPSPWRRATRRSTPGSLMPAPNGVRRSCGQHDNDRRALVCIAPNERVDVRSDQGADRENAVDGTESMG